MLPDSRDSGNIRVFLFDPNLSEGIHLLPAVLPEANSQNSSLGLPPVILLTLEFMQLAYRESLPSLPYLTVPDGLYPF